MTYAKLGNSYVNSLVETRHSVVGVRHRRRPAMTRGVHAKIYEVGGMAFSTVPQCRACRILLGATRYQYLNLRLKFA